MPFTQNSAPTFAKQPRKGLAQIANADASNLKALVTAGASGSKVVAIYAATNETSARDIQLVVTRSGTNYILGTVTVPIGSGNSGSVPSVDLLPATQFPAGVLPLDQDGQKYLELESGDVLYVKSLTTVTAARTMDIHAEYSDF